ncbi:transposase [Bradyrhizobium sp. USDA 372]
MIPSGVKVFLASHPVDFRKGTDGLVALVRDAGSDPFDGALYVFRAKRADRIKIVWWHSSGVCLYLKRLEKAKFCWPRNRASSDTDKSAQLMALVDGMDGEAGPGCGGHAGGKRCDEVNQRLKGRENRSNRCSGRGNAPARSRPPE